MAGKGGLNNPFVDSSTLGEDTETELGGLINPFADEPADTATPSDNAFNPLVPKDNAPNGLPLTEVQDAQRKLPDVPVGAIENADPADLQNTLNVKEFEDTVAQVEDLVKPMSFLDSVAHQFGIGVDAFIASTIKEKPANALLSANDGLRTTSLVLEKLGVDTTKHKEVFEAMELQETRWIYDVLRGKRERTLAGLEKSQITQNFLNNSAPAREGEDFIETGARIAKNIKNDPAGAGAFITESAARHGSPIVASILAAVLTRGRGLGARVAAGGSVQGAGTYIIEKDIIPFEALEEEYGYDITTTEGFEAFANDRAAIAFVNDWGHKRGLVIGLASVLGVGVGSVHLGVGKSALTQTATNLVAQAGSQMALGGGSEAIAMLWTEGHIDADEVWWEALGETITTPFDILAAGTELVKKSKEGSSESSEPTEPLTEVDLRTADIVFSDSDVSEQAYTDRLVESIDERTEVITAEGVKKIKEVAKLAGKSQLVKQFPDKTAKIIADVVAQNSLPDEYSMSAKVLLDYDKSRTEQGLPSIMEEMGLSRQEVEVSADMGGSVPLGTGEVIKQIIGDKGFEEVLRHLRIGKHGRTEAEVELSKAQIEQDEKTKGFLAELTKQYEGQVWFSQNAEVVADHDKIVGAVGGQLKEQEAFTGRDKANLAERAVQERVDAMASLVARYYVVRASRITEARGEYESPYALFEKDKLVFTADAGDEFLGKLNITSDNEGNLVSHSVLFKRNDVGDLLQGTAKLFFNRLLSDSAEFGGEFKRDTDALIEHYTKDKAAMDALRRGALERMVDREIVGEPEVNSFQRDPEYKEYLLDSARRGLKEYENEGLDVPFLKEALLEQERRIENDEPLLLMRVNHTESELIEDRGHPVFTGTDIMRTYKAYGKEHFTGNATETALFVEEPIDALDLDSDEGRQKLADWYRPSFQAKLDDLFIQIKADLEADTRVETPVAEIVEGIEASVEDEAFMNQLEAYNSHIWNHVVKVGFFLDDIFGLPSFQFLESVGELSKPDPRHYPADFALKHFLTSRGLSAARLKGIENDKYDQIEVAFDSAAFSKAEVHAKHDLKAREAEEVADKQAVAAVAEAVEEVHEAEVADADVPPAVMKRMTALHNKAKKLMPEIKKHNYLEEYSDFKRIISHFIDRSPADLMAQWSGITDPADVAEGYEAAYEMAVYQYERAIAKTQSEKVKATKKLKPATERYAKLTQELLAKNTISKGEGAIKSEIERQQAMIERLKNVTVGMAEKSKAEQIARHTREIELLEAGRAELEVEPEPSLAKKAVEKVKEAVAPKPTILQRMAKGLASYKYFRVTGQGILLVAKDRDGQSLTTTIANSSLMFRMARADTAEGDFDVGDEATFESEDDEGGSRSPKQMIGLTEDAFELYVKKAIHKHMSYMTDEELSAITAERPEFWSSYKAIFNAVKGEAEQNLKTAKGDKGKQVQPTAVSMEAMAEQKIDPMTAALQTMAEADTPAVEPVADTPAVEPSVVIDKEFRQDIIKTIDEGLAKYEADGINDPALKEALLENRRRAESGEPLLTMRENHAGSSAVQSAFKFKGTDSGTDGLAISLGYDFVSTLLAYGKEHWTGSARTERLFVAEPDNVLNINDGEGLATLKGWVGRKFEAVIKDMRDSGEYGTPESEALDDYDWIDDEGLEGAARVVKAFLDSDTEYTAFVGLQSLGELMDRHITEDDIAPTNIAITHFMRENDLPAVRLTGAKPFNQWELAINPDYFTEDMVVSKQDLKGADTSTPEPAPKPKRKVDTRLTPRTTTRNMLIDASDEELKAILANRDEQSPLYDALMQTMVDDFGTDYESYSYDGNAPTAALKRLFARIASWLAKLYRTAKRSVPNFEVSPEVREVMNRMLAAEAEIELVKHRHELSRPFFDKADALGIPDAVIREQARKNQRASERSKARQVNRRTGEYLGAQRKEYEAIKTELTAEVSQEPIYRLIYGASGGALFDGTEDTSIGRIYKPDLEEMIPLVDVPKGNRGRAIYTGVKKDSISPEAAAVEAGFTGTGDMIEAFKSYKPPKARIEELARAEMESRYPASAQELAEDSVHGSGFDDVIFDRLVALGAAVSNKYAFNKPSIKRVAEAMLMDLPTNVVLLNERLGADEEMHAREARRFYKQGNLLKAMEHSYMELVYHYMVQKTAKKREEVKAGVQYAKGLTKKAAEGKRSASMNDVIRKVVAQVRFIKNNKSAGAQINKIELEQRLNELADETNRDILQALPADLVRESTNDYYKEMPLGKFLDWVNALRALDAQGRDMLRVRVGKENMVLADVKRDIKNDMVESGLLSKAKLASDASVGSEIRGLLAGTTRVKEGWHSWVIKPGDLAYIMGNQQDFSTARMVLFQPFVEARTNYNVVMGEVYEVWKTHTDILSKVGAPDLNKAVPAHLIPASLRKTKSPGKRPVFKAGSRRVYLKDEEDNQVIDTKGKPVYEARLLESDIPRQWTYGEIFAILLNWGNPDNREAVLNTFKLSGAEDLTIADIEEGLFSLMSIEHFDFAQAIWDKYEALYPALEAIQRRETGRPPVRVQASRLEIVRDGKTYTWRGGYYPKAYERGQISGGSQVSTDEVFNSKLNPIMLMMAENGFLRTRVPNVNKKLLLNLSVVLSSFEDVALFATSFNAVKAARKVLSDSGVQEQVRTTLGEPYLDALNDFVVSQVRRRYEAQSIFEWILLKIRNNMSVAVQGLNPRTLSAQQIGHLPPFYYIPKRLGLPQFSVDFTKRYTNNMVISTAYFAPNSLYLSNPNIPKPKAFELVSQNEWLNQRVVKLDATLAEAIDDTRGKKGVIRHVGRVAMQSIGWAQRGPDIATFLTAYEYAMERDMTETQAEQFAEEMVRISQGGGEVYEQNRLQRAPSALLKLLTMFWTYASAMYSGMLVSATGIRSAEDGRALFKASADFATFFIIVIVGSGLVYETVINRASPEDRDEDGDIDIWELLMFGGKAAFGEFIWMFPLFKEWFSYADTGSTGSSISPIGREINRVIKTIDRLIDAGTEWTEWTADDWVAFFDNLWRSMSIIFGLPASGVAGNILDELYGEHSELDEDYNPQGSFQRFLDILYGETHKK